MFSQIGQKYIVIDGAGYLYRPGKHMFIDIENIFSYKTKMFCTGKTNISSQIRQNIFTYKTKMFSQARHTYLHG